MLILCLLAFTYPLSSSAISFIMPAIGIANGIGFAAHQALLANITPAEVRGAVMGLFNTVMGLTSTVGPLMGGLIWDALGDTALFHVCALSLVPAITFYALVYLKRR